MFGLVKERLRGHLVALCSFQRRDREVLIALLWDPVIEHMGVVQSCTRGGLDSTLVSSSLLREWSNPGTGFRELVSKFVLIPGLVLGIHLANCLNLCAVFGWDRVNFLHSS